MANIGGDHPLCALLDAGSANHPPDLHRYNKVTGLLLLTHSCADRTDGSYIEKKETGLTWHYEHTDTEFGTYQAKDLFGHLEVTLAGSLQVRLSFF